MLFPCFICSTKQKLECDPYTVEGGLIQSNTSNLAETNSHCNEQTNLSEHHDYDEQHANFDMVCYENVPSITSASFKSGSTNETDPQALHEFLRRQSENALGLGILGAKNFWSSDLYASPNKPVPVQPTNLVKTDEEGLPSSITVSMEPGMAENSNAARLKIAGEEALRRYSTSPEEIQIMASSSFGSTIDTQVSRSTLGSYRSKIPSQCSVDTLISKISGQCSRDKPRKSDKSHEYCCNEDTNIMVSHLLAEREAVMRLMAVRLEGLRDHQHT